MSGISCAVSCIPWACPGGASSPEAASTEALQHLAVQHPSTILQLHTGLIPCDTESTLKNSDFQGVSFSAPTSFNASNLPGQNTKPISLTEEHHSVHKHE